MKIRESVMMTGKQGAISLSILLAKGTLNSKEDVNALREKLTLELKEGAYKVTKDGVEYIG